MNWEIRRQKCRYHAEHFEYFDTYFVLLASTAYPDGLLPNIGISMSLSMLTVIEMSNNDIYIFGNGD